MRTAEVPERRASHIFQSKEHKAAYHHHLCCCRKQPQSSPYQPSRGSTLSSPAYLQSLWGGMISCPLLAGASAGEAFVPSCVEQARLLNFWVWPKKKISKKAADRCIASSYYQRSPAWHLCPCKGLCCRHWNRCQAFLDLLQDRRPLKLTACYVLDALLYHLVSVTICYLWSMIVPVSQVSLCFGFLVEHLSWSQLLSAILSEQLSVRDWGEHLLVERQEQGFIPEGIFVLPTPQRKAITEKMSYKK